MNSDSREFAISYVNIDRIKAKQNYSCVGGPFGSALSRKHYVEKGGVPVIRGVNLGGDRYHDEGYVFVSEDKGDELHRNLAFPGDIVFTQRGTLGQVAIIPDNAKYNRYVVSQSQMKLSVNLEMADPYYVYSYFRTWEAKRLIENSAIVGGVPHINLGIFKAIEIPLPSLRKQKKIASMIRNFDDKIELNHQTNKTLEQIAQAIFKSWFIDFEPTRAKIAAKQNGQDPERAAMCAISGRSLDELDQLGPEVQRQLKSTAALFPDVLVESELGEIPEGWESSKLGAYFNIVMGQSPKGDTFNEEGEGTLFFQGRRDFGFRFPIPRVYTTEPKRFAQAGDALISVRAPVGDKNMALCECCLGRGVAGIRHKSGSRSFTYALISHIEQGLSNNGSDGTVFSSINKKELNAVPFISPDKCLVFLFEEKIYAVDQHIETSSKEIELLENLRDNLLPKLLSGELLIKSTQTDKNKQHELSSYSS